MALVELKITVGDDGQLRVTGPIDQRGLCYQLLELARDAIKEHNDQLQKSPIIPPTNGDILSISRK